MTYITYIPCIYVYVYIYIYHNSFHTVWNHTHPHTHVKWCSPWEAVVNTWIPAACWPFSSPTCNVEKVRLLWNRKVGHLERSRIPTKLFGHRDIAPLFLRFFSLQGVSEQNLATKDVTHLQAKVLEGSAPSQVCFLPSVWCRRKAAEQGLQWGWAFHPDGIGAVPWAPRQVCGRRRPGEDMPTAAWRIWLLGSNWSIMSDCLFCLSGCFADCRARKYSKSTFMSGGAGGCAEGLVHLRLLYANHIRQMLNPYEETLIMEKTGDRYHLSKLDLLFFHFFSIILSGPRYLYSSIVV